MKERILSFASLLLYFATIPVSSRAQSDAHVSARISARQISVGDQVHLFIEAQHNPLRSKLQWALIPDSFNRLEVVAKGRIDTVKNGDLVTYKQRLDITGFDSGLFTIPAFDFSVIPNQGITSVVQTDSFPVLVQTIPVDTSKAFKPIKGIQEVKRSWQDYIWWIVGGVLLLGLLVFLFFYFFRNKKNPVPVQQPAAPQESIQQKALRLLAELEQEQLWQSGKVKEYYVRLTEIVRSYIEARFQTAALELTTDELLDKAGKQAALLPFHNLLATILRTADLAKFAKAEPLPQEHVDAMSLSRRFIEASTPVPAANSETHKQS